MAHLRYRGFMEPPFGVPNFRYELTCRSRVVGEAYIEQGEPDGSGHRFWVSSAYAGPPTPGEREVLADDELHRSRRAAERRLRRVAASVRCGKG